MYRSSSPQMVRSMDGHGSFRTRKPPPPSGTLWPWSSTTSATTPGSARMAAPGLPAVTPGSGLIMIEPVSVCHQVSTTGQRPPPMTARYHTYASGLIGAPTEPSSRRLDRSYLAGMSSPHFMNIRITVGAQYRIDTLYLLTISHHRPRSGVSGVPSYMTEVAPLA